MKQLNEQGVANGNPNENNAQPEGHKVQTTPAVRPGYIRKADAARYLGISVRTLTDWMQQHVVAYIKMSHRVCLFRMSDLDAAMNRFRFKAAGE